jgi:NAD(P)-dependent dehydrogenase (short-subunit alcohol dehydrogenase family)
MEGADAQLAMLFGMHGKHVIVTGASSGMGTAVAELFIAVGAKVVAAATTPSKVEAVAATLKKKAKGQADVLGAVVDVSDQASVIKLYDTAESAFGAVDALISCAGIYPTESFVDVSVELWDRVHAVNTRGAFLITREAVRRMKSAGKGGAIVAVSSVSTHQAVVFGHAQYASSKAGVNALIRTIALEFAADGIRANAVLPGPIITEGLLASQAGYAAENRVIVGPVMQAERAPTNRPGMPMDVAAACLFLASPGANHITGQLLMVDGGFQLS